jgi:hypothetical protein
MEGSIMRRILTILLSSVYVGVPGAADVPAPFIVRYESETLTVRAPAMPAAAVLAAVAEQTGARIVRDASVPATQPADFERLPLARALERLFPTCGATIRYDRDGRPARIELHGSRRAPGSERDPTAADAAAAPPAADGPSGPDPEAAVLDPGPLLEALAESPDLQRRALRQLRRLGADTTLEMLRGGIGSATPTVLGRAAGDGRLRKLRHLAERLRRADTRASSDTP